MALPAMGAAGVQLAWVIAVGEQTAVATLGAALATSVIRLICVTAQQHITYTPPMVRHEGYMKIANTP